MSSSVSPLKEILLATAPMLAPRSSRASSRRGLGSGVMVKEAAIWVEEAEARGWRGLLGWRPSPVWCGV